jgi:hypothetical protein
MGGTRIASTAIRAPTFFAAGTSFFRVAIGPVYQRRGLSHATRVGAAMAGKDRHQQ